MPNRRFDLTSASKPKSLGTMAATKCLVVDDHSVVQQGLELLIGEYEEHGDVSGGE